MGVCVPPPGPGKTLLAEGNASQSLENFAMSQSQPNGKSQMGVVRLSPALTPLLSPLPVSVSPTCLPGAERPVPCISACNCPYTLASRTSWCCVQKSGCGERTIGRGHG